MNEIVIVNDEFVPHPTFCCRCGVRLLEVVKVPVYVTYLENGDSFYHTESIVGFCLEKFGFTQEDVLKTDRVANGASVPSGKPCSICVARTNEEMQVVKDGGIYWSCKECSMNGVMRKNDFTAVVRGVEGAPPGVTFATCAEHVSIGIQKRVVS